MPEQNDNNQRESKVKVFWKILKRFNRRKLIVIPTIIVILVVAIVPSIFYGATRRIVEKVSDFFNDVLDNIKIVGNNLQIDEEYLDEAKKKLEKMGINAADLGLTGHEDYLERFLEAEIVTNFPYLGGDGLQGTVYFERYKSDGTTVQLEYKEYNEFYSIKNSGNTSDLSNYFTIDVEDWTVHVLKNSENGSSDIEKINYKDMVSKYSMPFEFPIALAMSTQNPQFTLALVNLVKDSKIVVGILETRVEVETEKTYTSKRYTTSTNIETGEVINSRVDDITEDRSPSERDITYSTTVTLARANTWILNEVTDLKWNSPEVVEQEPTEQRFDETRSVTESNGIETAVQDRERKITTKVTVYTYKWNVGTTEIIDKTSNFINLILRDTTFISGNGLVEIAKRCHDYLAENEYYYSSQANINAGTYVSDGPSVTHKFPEEGEPMSQRYMDCSAYVSWVLKTAGYDIGCLSSSGIPTYAEEKGWEKIENVNDLQPGDIGVFSGHVNIFVGESDGKMLAYDCGMTSSIRAKEPIAYNFNTMICAYRPNDDIAKALSPESTEDLEEKINNYISSLSNGTFSVHVKDLDKQGEACSINNEKVASDGLIKIFIMIAAYQEVKDGNIEESLISSDIERMITTDSGNAANLVLRTIGKAHSEKQDENEEDIDKYIEKGIEIVNDNIKGKYSKTKINTRLSENTDGNEQISVDDNYTCISDVSKALEFIFEKKDKHFDTWKTYAEKMYNILQGQIYTDMIPSTIENGTIANKTGNQQNVLEDAAIISIDNANYILAISVNDFSDKNQAKEQIKEISNLVYGYFLDNGKLKDNTNNTVDEDDEIDYIMNGNRVCYKIEGALNGYQCPLENLEEGSGILFDILKSNEKTQSHERLMRYLLYLLTGDDKYGVTEFDFKEFLNGSFAGAGGAWTAIWGDACTKEEFISAVNSYSPPNAYGNSGRSCVEYYKKYFVANAENFYNICTKNGMDPRFIFCIGIHESYFGTSNIANTKGNFFGWGAYDWDPGGSAIAFADMSEGIEDVSAGLKNYVTPGTWQYERIKANGYDPTTIEGIGSLYASDDNWANAVKQHMTNIFGCTGSAGTIDGPATDMQKKIVELATNDSVPAYSNGCQAWVADVYLAAGQRPRTSMGTANLARQAWSISLDRNNIPLGAAVYGTHAWGGGAAGHVGIYVGDGKIASDELGKITYKTIDQFVSGYGWGGWGWNGGIDYSKSN